MGKKKFYKKLCNQYMEFCDSAFDSASSALELAKHAIKDWKPSKCHGLSKKEVRAAFRGFALGVANGADTVVRGMRLGDEDDSKIREWLLVNVAGECDDEERDDDGPSAKVVEVGPDDVKEIDFRELIKAMFGTDDESE